MVIPWDDANHVDHFGRLRSLAFEGIKGSHDICLAMTEIPEKDRSPINEDDHMVSFLKILHYYLTLIAIYNFPIRNFFPILYRSRRINVLTLPWVLSFSMLPNPKI